MRNLILLFGLSFFSTSLFALLPDLDAQDNTVPSLAPMLKNTIPAVVNISTRGNMKVQRPASPFNDPFFDFFFNRPEQEGSVETNSLGSGVVVDAKNGIILTNNHVIKNADKILVTLHDGRQYDAELIGSDTETDIAVVKIKAENLNELKVADLNKLRVGDYVVAIGNAFGLGQTVTSGIVSALHRSGLQILGYENFIQTDASINQGNSGGALVNLKGELVGINTAILSRSGGSVGIGFAIPIDLATDIMNQLLDTGKVERGFLGVIVQDVTPDMAEAFGLKITSGAIVSKVLPDSPAGKGGLKADDIIIAIDNKKVKTASDVRNIIGLSKAGKTTTMRYIRDGKERTARIEVALKKADILSAAEEKDLDERLTGLVLQPLDETHPLAGQVKNGVVVSSLEAGSRAARTGLRPGDLLISVNREEVDSVKDFYAKVKKLSDKQIVLRVLRGNSAFYLLLN